MALGVYVHLPFCPYICPYCDFAKWPMRASSARRYFAALQTELSREPARAATTLFLGGGTPNAYAAAEIASLVASVRERFSRGNSIRETTIEVNPELVRDRDFAAYRECGIDRVSIGVQSFVAAEIAILGRKHTVDDVRRAVDSARRAGIASISLDLMFAVPGQTLQTWAQSLRTAIGLGVDHISTYGLTIEEGTPYHAWAAREPAAFVDNDAEADLYERAISTLSGAGYEQYEISNFARRGHESAHNRNYWANGEYIGLGVGAASYRDGVRSTHTRELDEYCEAVESGKNIPGESERLEGIKVVGEAVMLALRTAQGVELAAFKERYGVDIRERYAPVLQTYTQAGFLEIGATTMRLTGRGRFVANDVCGAFVTFE